MTSDHSAPKKRGKIAAAVGVGVLIAALATGCNSSDSNDKSSNDKPIVTATAPSTINDTEGDQAALPELVGMNHQAAQDKAQSLGFYDLREKDASGADRMLVWDRNWTVCDQDPLPGTYPTNIQVTLYSVKIGESCPP